MKAFLKKRMRIANQLALTASAIVFLALVSVLSCNWLVGQSAEPYMYSDVRHLPYNHVGLVLGTSKKLKNGQPNPYFEARIHAAAQLYHAGKIHRIVVSGDNATPYYNEPVDMFKALVALDVPKNAIYLDYAGFRTLDSVLRCKKVFGQSQFTIVSQDFHNERAIFLSRLSGISAVAYNAPTYVPIHPQLSFRESLARVKAFMDIYLLHSQPKFLGESISVI